MKSLPVFFHVPKAAGTYAISIFIGLLRAYRLKSPHSVSALHETIKNIQIHHNSAIIGRLIALDWNNAASVHCKPIGDSPIDYTCTMDDVIQLLKVPPTQFECFVLCVESDGFPIWETIVKPFENTFKCHKFMFMRDPIERQISLFNYLSSDKSAHEYSHENVRQDPDGKADFDVFLKNHGSYEDSWLIRMLCKVPIREKLNQTHLDSAIQILNQFTISSMSDVDRGIELQFDMAHNVTLSKINKRFLSETQYNATESKRIPQVSEQARAHLFWDYKLYDHYVNNNHYS